MIPATSDLRPPTPSEQPTGGVRRSATTAVNVLFFSLLASTAAMACVDLRGWPSPTSSISPPIGHRCSKQAGLKLQIYPPTAPPCWGSASAVVDVHSYGNTSDATPCNWPGVTCENERVTVLRLPGSSLSGSIPPYTLSNLTRLRTLSLRLNRLSGQLPSDLSQCVELRNLYLQGNRFSGAIPASLFDLHSLVRLNLASNNISGQLPPRFNNLTRLRTLFLENNQFSGSIPELNLPNLIQLNVSFNNLNGSIPKSLEAMPEDSFSGNSLCGKPLGVCPGGDATPPVAPALATGGIEIGSTNKKKLSGGAIAGIVIGSVVGLLLLLLLLILLVVCRKRSGNKAPNGKGEESSGKKLVFLGNTSTVFDLEDLLRASAEVLGKGTFGTAYKAVLEMGTIVAVKRLKDVSIAEAEFREKIELLVGGMNHQCLLPLRAYYYSREEKLLVYDYMPMGSLSALLHGKGAGRTPLNWDLRSGIALAAARGIEYLHSQGHAVSHGNIKSSNILLTKSYEARVSDFGIANVVGPSSSPTRVAGYRAPEVTEPRRVSQKADVYSFGVLLLELLTGKAPTHALLNEEGVDLPRWVQSVVREEWTSEVFDLELLPPPECLRKKWWELLQLAIDCAAQYPDNRPSMTEVANRIEELSHSSLRNQQPSELVPETE
nr:probable inactive receptor kinase At1g48480 [Ipomoea batatas]